MKGLRNTIDEVVQELQGYVQEGEELHFEVRVGDFNIEGDVTAGDIAALHAMLPLVRFSVPMRSIDSSKGHSR